MKKNNQGLAPSCSFKGTKLGYKTRIYNFAIFPQAPVCGISHIEGGDAYDPDGGAAVMTVGAITKET